jgi:hypothetical protein
MELDRSGSEVLSAAEAVTLGTVGVGRAAIPRVPSGRWRERKRRVGQ